MALIEIDSSVPEPYRKSLEIGDSHEWGKSLDSKKGRFVGGYGYDGKISRFAEARKAANDFCSKNDPQKCQKFLEYLERSGYAMLRIDIETKTPECDSSAGDECIKSLAGSVVVSAFVERLQSREDTLANAGIWAINVLRTFPLASKYRLVDELERSGVLEHEDEVVALAGIDILEELAYENDIPIGLQAKIIEAIFISRNHDNFLVVERGKEALSNLRGQVDLSLVSIIDEALARYN